jgi:DNA-damage-inducible protein J
MTAIPRKQTSIRVDPKAWEEAKTIFKEYGLTASDAINVFLNKVRLEGGLPFEIKVPSKRLKEAINEANNKIGNFIEINSKDDLKKALL